MGHEQNGQLYALDIEEHLHEQALGLHQQALTDFNTAEQRLLRQRTVGVERTEVLAAYNRHEEKLLKLTSYCVRQGLLDLEPEAA